NPKRPAMPLIVLALLLAYPATPQQSPVDRFDALDSISDTLRTVDTDLDLFIAAATRANQSKGLAALSDLANNSTANRAEIEAGYETIRNYSSSVRIALARASRTAAAGSLDGVARELQRATACLALRDVADSEIVLIRENDLIALSKVTESLGACLCVHRAHLEDYSGARRKERRAMSDENMRIAVVERVASRPRDAIRLALFNLRSAVNAAQAEIVQAYAE
ncbi:MAG: hypothetical protein TH68_08355, partial [Candidatus Synechococcus spongiarum 142]